MSAIWLYPVIIVAGLLQAAGAAMSAQLRTSLGNPWLAATVSFGSSCASSSCSSR